MNESEFLDLVRELELELFSREFNRWVRTLSDEDKKKIRVLRTEVSIYRSQLETNQLKVLADKLEELTPDLAAGMKDLQKELDEMNDFIKTVEFLGRVLGVVSRIVTPVL